MPKAEGGEDSESNCIALCFDCHADVGSYNPQHPKGRRFTAPELREHRDAWFNKMASSTGLPRDEEFRDLDFKLFKRLWALLGRPEVQDFLENHHFGSEFPRSHSEPVVRFCQWSMRPEFEFYDADLEQQRAALVEKAEKLRAAMGVHTVLLSTEPEYYGIPKEMSHERPDIWKERVATLNENATELFVALDGFARFARRKLGFDFEDLDIEL